MNISKEALLADLEAVKAQKGKLYQNDYRDAIDRAPAVAAEGGADWVSVKDRLPEGKTTTLVTAVKPGGARVLMTSSFKPEGYFNGGRNKWDCEPVIGTHAGYKVIAWLPLPKIFEG